MAPSVCPSVRKQSSSIKRECILSQDKVSHTRIDDPVFLVSEFCPFENHKKSCKDHNSSSSNFLGMCIRSRRCNAFNSG